MRVLFLVPYPEQGASNRFRVLQFVPCLEAAGIGCRVRPFYSETLWRVLYQPGHFWTKLALGVACSLDRLLDLVRSVRCDLVFIHREAFPVGPAWFETLLTWMGKPYVYDFDDALFLPNVAESNRLFGRLKCPGKVARIIRGSRVAVAGNAYLAGYAESAGARRVEIVPTVVDTGRFKPPQAEKTPGKLVIGWIGSSTTAAFLEPFRKVFARVRDRCGERVEFRLVGGKLSEPLPQGVACADWSLESEIEQLQSFDIGIMPMPDNEWTRGKCAFKAIEYLSVGIPAVCSPVGMNLEVVGDGLSGYLPPDEDSWVEALCRLVEDDDLRRSLGSAGRRVVERKFSVELWAPELERIIRSAAGN
ncbi:MAG: glycosyltransferase family 4 protein [Candidatus Glassbacteria bacterium]|nr:glycosyltransferase family 4 protein [Candidatus Glassbacteria bacterium]